MVWFRVMFILVMVRRLDTFQNEDYDESDSNTTVQITCPLSNFVVTPVFNNQTNYINLKLSWDKPKINDFVNILIHEPMDFSKTSKCLSEIFIFNHSLLENSVLEPNMVTEDEVERGCSYEITFYSDEETGIYCSYNYTVPEEEENDNANEFIELVQCGVEKWNNFNSSGSLKFCTSLLKFV